MVAFVEFSVFLLHRNKTQAEIEGLLRRFRVEIEWFKTDYGRHAASTGFQNKDFRKNWRDHMIAAHAHTAPLVLITHNTNDFAFLGNRVMNPADAMKYLQ